MMTEPETTPALSLRAGWLEAAGLLRLAWPLALGNLAQVAMSATDVIMMGRLGPETVAAGALAANLFYVALVAGIGLLNAGSPIMARDLGRDGAKAAGAVADTVKQCLWSALALAVPAWLVLWQGEALLVGMGQDAALAAQAGTYLRLLQWSVLPLWVFLILRAFTAALQRPRAALAIAALGVVANGLGNWCLMLGKCGLAPMGIAGSGLATVLASWLMVAGLAGVVLCDKAFAKFGVLRGRWTPSLRRLAEIWWLGLPMAAMLLFEVTVFNAAVFLMGFFGATALAAHAIAIQIASLTFMVPLGIGQAATVRVGLAYGAGDRRGIHRAGWAAFWLAIGFMTATSCLMLMAPGPLIRAFLDAADPANAQTIALAGSFLVLAALFQIADGAQAVGGGMLRGLHDARIPMLYALFGYWGVGLPVGWLLAFRLGFGGLGIWIGLAIGLGVVAVLVIRRWIHRDKLGLLPERRLRGHNADVDAMGRPW